MKRKEGGKSALQYLNPHSHACEPAVLSPVLLHMCQVAHMQVRLGKSVTI